MREFFESSPIFFYKKTLGIFAFLILSMSIPVTLIAVSNQQDIRQQAQLATFPCSKEEAEQGLRTQTCNGGENCSGVQYSEFESCKDTNNDGECDNYICRWSACGNPVSCSGSFSCNADEANNGTKKQACRAANGCIGTQQSVKAGQDAINGTYSCSWTECATEPNCTPDQPTPAVSSMPQSGTPIELSIKLPGIGTDGNTNPTTISRTAIVTVLSSTNEELYTISVPVIFDGTLFRGTGIAQHTTAQTGPSNVKVKLETTLRKAVPGTFTFSQTASIKLPQISLESGDMNNDNVMNVQDYNVFLSCYGNPLCSEKAKADLNDDGLINGIDYNIFVRSYSIQEGD